MKAKIITWKSVIVLALIGYLLRTVTVVVYCFLCHLVFYRWSSCLNDEFVPKSFSDLSSVTLTTTMVSTGSCSGTETVLVYVPSSLEQFERRNTIRETWAKEISMNGRAKLVFVLGKAAPGEVADTFRLRAESTTFRDLIQFNIIDHYHNLTLKTRAVFEWTLENCPRIDFLIRADSDIVLNVDRLFRFLNFQKSMSDLDPSKNPIVFGRCRKYDCVTRLPWSKSCLPRSFYETMQKPFFYPSYCLGFSNILSMAYLRKANESWRRSLSEKKQDYLPMEDLHSIGYTGEKINALKIGLKNLFVFDQYFDSYSCQNGPIASAAYEDDKEMRRRWEKFRERCTEE